MATLNDHFKPEDAYPYEDEPALVWEPEAMYPYDAEACPACHGTGQNYTDPHDGGSCPHCINGRRFV